MYVKKSKSNHTAIEIMKNTNNWFIILLFLAITNKAIIKINNTLIDGRNTILFNDGQESLIQHTDI